MANVKHAGRKRKITSDDKARAYQRRQSKQAKKVQNGLKNLQQTPPNHLDLVAKRLWRSIAPELIKIGNIKQLDCMNLEALCTTYSIYLKAEKDYEQYGSYVETDKGSLMKNPAISIISDCARNMKSLSGVIKEVCADKEA